MAMTLEQQRAVALARARAAAQQTPSPEAPDRGVFNAMTEGSQAGLMLGFDDEIGAGMMAPIHATKDWAQGKGFNLGENYTRLQQELDANKSARREQHPVASIAGEVAGGLATGAGAAKSGLTLAARPAKSIAGRIGLGAAEGAGYGAAYGAGEAAPGERIEGAGTGAAIGGLAGGALGGIGGAMANRTAQKAVPPAPTVDDLRSTGNALYNTAKNAGVMVNPQAYDQMASRVAQQMKAFAFNPQLQPKTAVALKEMMAQRGKPLSLPELENVRKIASTVSREAVDASDKKAAGIIVQEIDDLIDNGSNFSAGSHNALKALQEARGVWKQKMKAEMIGEMFDRADLDTSKFTQSGMVNTIVREFRSLAKNPKKMRMFSADEQEMIREIVKGTPGEKALRWVGKLAPRGVVSASAGTFLGNAAMGPAGFIVGPAVGQGAAMAADRAAMAGVNRLQDTVLRGSRQALPQLPNRLAPLIPGAVEASMGIRRSLSR